MNQASCGHRKHCAAARPLAASALLLLLFEAIPLPAQNSPPPEADPRPRQKVGLVLEGGGGTAGNGTDHRKIFFQLDRFF